MRQRLHGLNLSTRVKNYQDRRESLQRLLVTTTKNTINGNRVRLEKAQDALLSLDTSRIVARGYAIVNKNDKPLTTIKDITEGEQLTIQMRDGQLEVEVKNVNEKTFEENLQDLEAIVTKLETGDVALEDAIAEFQKVWYCLKICRRPWKMLKNTC